jgi:hypothetical protein
MVGSRFPAIFVVLLIVFFCETNGYIKNTCYKCVAEGKRGPCAYDFQLMKRDHFQENCTSGWCLKVEVGSMGSKSVGAGHIER